jgi:hypothetical protein
MSEIIKFTDTKGIAEDYKPKPSDKFIPDWYKTMDSYINKNKEPNGFGETTATIKRCMPVFDSITTGYIITTYVDLWVKQVPVVPKDLIVDENTDLSEYPTQPFYEWSNHGLIEFHPVVQAPNHPSRGRHESDYPKFLNPWAIKTPPGYSTLFIQPLHRSSPFTILPGVVDTDKYNAPVNFPFALNEADKFKGLIPAGTPIAQVIPFKRDSWKMEIGDIEEIREQAKTTNRLRSMFFDSYKKQFRQTKEYL